ncbi:MAG: hypothetical protein KC609_13405, partial [Myxococcales bacterium]|nr:hypothetical protein [Myxococcales bacterium]
LSLMMLLFVVEHPSIVRAAAPLVDPTLLDPTIPPDTGKSSKKQNVFRGFVSVELALGIAAIAYCSVALGGQSRGLAPGIWAVVAGTVNLAFGAATLGGTAPDGLSRENRGYGWTSLALGGVNFALGITQLILSNRPKRSTLTLAPAIDRHRGATSVHLVLSARF